MHPLNHAAQRSLAPESRPAADSDGDLDATISFSDSEDGVPDPPELQLLARAILAWDPMMVTAYSRQDHVAGHSAAFADFLVKLNIEVVTPALRGEIIGWLRTIALRDDRRTRAFQIAATQRGLKPALEIYEAMRAASQ